MQQNQPSKRTALVFADLHKLWAFSKSLHTQNLVMNTRQKSLLCECEESDIERAIADYGAAFYEEIDQNHPKAVSDTTKQKAAD